MLISIELLHEVRATCMTVVESTIHSNRLSPEAETTAPLIVNLRFRTSSVVKFEPSRFVIMKGSSFPVVKNGRAGSVV